MYRNFGNYKKFGQIIFSNPSNLKIKRATSILKTKLIDEEFFYPSKVGVPKFHKNDFDLEMDWFEFIKFSYTSETATEKKDIEKFLSDFNTKQKPYQLDKCEKLLYKFLWNYCNSNEINADKNILKWIEAEYDLFKTIEHNRYSDLIKFPFSSVEELVKSANTILNRRKSRAGKSLEIFKIAELIFQTQVTTENNKKPDFLFPNIEACKNPKFDDKKLILLAAKTTCKDRWRQILNEADRIETKHLFTLQQGISKNQLEEMKRYNVQLVVPKAYISSFPPEYRTDLLVLEKFIKKVAATQN